ncbi:MAG: PAS domain-containing protein [Loktanella sp.]|nr:PAS domain-containing protein [Loktanella sp.]
MPDQTYDLETALAVALAELDAAREKIKQLEALSDLGERLMGAGSFQMDWDTMQVRWSDNTFRMFGTSREEFGQSYASVTEFIHPDDRASYDATMARVTATREPYSHSHRIMRPDGEVRYVREAAATLGGPEGNLFLGVTQDITDLVKTKTSEAGLQAMVKLAGEIAKVGGWKVNLDTQTVEITPVTASFHDAPEVRTLPLSEAFSLYTDESSTRLQAAVAKSIGTGEGFDETATLVSRIGHERTVQVTGFVERDQGTGRIVGLKGAIKDITDLAAAHKAEEHFRSIYDLVPVLIWEEDWCNVRAMLLDLQSRGITDLSGYIGNHPEFVDAAIKSVQVLQVNQSGARIFGAETAEELLAAKDQIIDAPESRQLFQRALMAYLAGEREFESESVRSDINGRQLKLYVKMLIPDISSSDTRVVLTEMDVTELKNANELFQVVVNATSDVVWNFDVGVQKVWCSEGLRTSFGLDPHDFASGKAVWSDHLHPDERDHIMQQQNDLLNSTSTLWKTEHRFRRQDGSYADVRNHGTIIRDRHGNATRMIGSMLDVTKQNMIEAQLRQAQKLDAVGQLTGGIAHDFNNLLTVILGSIEVLADELGDEPRLERLAKISINAAERGAELTSRLLSFARRQSLNPKVVDVSELLLGMDGLLRRTLPEDVELEMVRRGGPWKIEVDATQLESAILNLALNAQDAMPVGGHLTIEVDSVTFDDEYVVSEPDGKAGQHVVISVTDTGHGMPADVASRVFEPFFTTKEVGKGSGLGLSMVYGFVKQSGGHVRVYSQPGKGTSLKLYFPRALAVDDQVVQAPVVKQVPRGQETILVVEDDDLVREHVVAQIKSLGYRVLQASNGVKALELINGNAEIGMLFTDVVMPGGMGGRDLANAAQLLRPDLKVLFTSGYAQNSMVHNGKLDKGVDLLSKPYKRDQLANKIRHSLDTDFQ